eukprot:Em0013g43a
METHRQRHGLSGILWVVFTLVVHGYADVCPPGWGGPQCMFCAGHVRITNSSGVILDHVGGSQYRDDSQCLFLIESNSSSVTISLNSVDMECDWDFVHVFDGDSVFSPKLGAFTGHLDNQIDYVMTNRTVSQSYAAVSTAS